VLVTNIDSVSSVVEQEDLNVIVEFMDSLIVHLDEKVRASD
jgi:hypothetical protein